MSLSKQSVAAAVLLVQATSVMADLRGAATPKNGFDVINQKNSVKFNAKSALYMEPSTFGYQGLINQKKNNYDNFLRSNIDNEQDNRDFDDEVGRDHLPYRTMEGESIGATWEIPVNTLQEFPLRWNNPHSSELEVNIWINDEIVVPIRKPACSGEGYQDNLVDFKVPADFPSIISKTGTNCCEDGDNCVLQIYAHSVEPRTYSIGVPIKLTQCGDYSSLPRTLDKSQIAPMTQDVGTNLNLLTRDLCLATTDPSVYFETAQPRWARQVSDVYNHAYQNSDYSPYSGQQAELISRNLQAACILRMTAANGGELGKSILSNSEKNLRQNLINKVNNVVNKYEKQANQIFKAVDGKLKEEAALNSQTLATCYRCEKVASLNTKRLETQTYIPSFQLPASMATEIKAKLSNSKQDMITSNNIVSIYVTSLNEVAEDFEEAAQKGVVYQGPAVKSSIRTMTDAAQFLKRNANGNKDGGKYAATQAKAAAAAAGPTTPPTRDPALVDAVEIVYDKNTGISEDEFFTILNDVELEGNPDDAYLPEPVTDEIDVDSAAGSLVASVVSVAATAAVAFAVLF